MKKKTLWITSAAVGAVLVLGGAGVAVAVADPFDQGDDRLTGSTLAKASAAALDAVGSGTVTDAETSDEFGSAYEVEVTLDNGEEVEVQLDESFAVLRTDGTAGTGDTSDISATDAAEAPLTEADRSAASAAALAAIAAGSAGTVTEVERSDDFDHAYEVEVTLPTGEDIDLELDENFTVLTIEGIPAA